MTQTKAGGAVLLFGLMSWLAASASASQGTPSPQRPAGGRGGFTSAPSEPAQLLFHEAWTRAPMSQPMVQDNLANKDLDLHIYGNANEIRKAFHPEEDYTYTGETIENWALTVSSRASYWNLAGDGRIRFRTRNSGYRFLHVVIKTGDGKYFVSEEGSGESTAWIETDYILSNLHWRNLLMTDTPSNASNRRQPNPKRTPIVATSTATPDLTKVDEVGFSDLMPGGWIPSTSRVNAFWLYGKAVPRK